MAKVRSSLPAASAMFSVCVPVWSSCTVKLSVVGVTMADGGFRGTGSPLPPSTMLPLPGAFALTVSVWFAVPSTVGANV